MPRYACRLDYDGTTFAGWQRQPEAVTVQSTLEEAFSKIFNTPVKIVGCGRTDAGVHAVDYLFHFDLSSSIKDSQQLIYKLNKVLPSTIVIRNLLDVPADFHARYDAISRTYTYKMHLGKEPFLEHYSYAYPYRSTDIQLNALNSAAKLLTGRHDFTAFCKTGSDVDTHICEIRKSVWIQKGNNFEYHVTANRFLRGMIRLIVGMCLNVSRGKLELNQVSDAIKNGERLILDWSVPGKGLTLQDIQYPNV